MNKNVNNNSKNLNSWIFGLLGLLSDLDYALKWVYKLFLDLNWIFLICLEEICETFLKKTGSWDRIQFFEVKCKFLGLTKNLYYFFYNFLDGFLMSYSICPYPHGSVENILEK